MHVDMLTTDTVFILDNKVFITDRWLILFSLGVH